MRAVWDRIFDSLALRVGSEVAGLALLGAALIGSIALATHSPSDPLFELAPVQNRVGPVGASMAGWLFATVGQGAVVVVAGVAWLGARLVLGLGLPGPTSRFWVGTVFLLLAVASAAPVLHGIFPESVSSAGGGTLGTWLAATERLYLGTWGAVLVNLVFLAIGLLGLTGVSTASALRAVGTACAFAGDWLLFAAERAWAGLRVLAVATGRGLASAGRSLARGLQEIRELPQRLRGAGALVEVWRERRARRARVDAIRFPGDESTDAEDFVEGEGSPVEVAAQDGEDAATSSASGRRRVEPHIVDHDSDVAPASPSQETFHFNDGGPARPFNLPEPSIFELPPASSAGYDRDSLLMNSRILEKKLADFGVLGRVVRVHPGPVVTMYEYEPAAGVKVNKIVNLTDDLAMALSALSIRIIAPLPGKSVVGIEVPNREREIVYLRSLLEARGASAPDGKLRIAMGKDIFGNPVESDLARMPHLLVAGATGTGKSVFLNSVLCSLLCRCTPNELKFLMIDPKMLELSIYDGIPHLIAEVVTNPKRAAAALKGVLAKMEERYRIMSALQVRNIDQYNALVNKRLEEGETTFRLKPLPGELEGVEVEYVRLPYIVVVVDELADLMVVASKDVEESLQRLAQMARAAGIHLVLATQRPSVDVLTGVIKANFPSRVSFQVSSVHDSRTVLDQKGAESLLGHGDMLFLPPGTSQLQRVHGPLVTEKEVTELVAYLRDQGDPEFDEDLLKASDAAVAGELSGTSDEPVDEMFDHAVAIVAETRNASISYIQRRLKIGYNRAARIVEHMETEGMVGPQDGTRPREVFLPNHDEDA